MITIPQYDLEIVIRKTRQLEQDRLDPQLAEDEVNDQSENENEDRNQNENQNDSVIEETMREIRQRSRLLTANTANAVDTARSPALMVGALLACYLPLIG